MALRHAAVPVKHGADGGACQKFFEEAVTTGLA